MSGGAWEYVMAPLANSVNGNFTVHNAGTWSSATATNPTYPDPKYYNIYSWSTISNSDIGTIQRGKLGDATKEVTKNFLSASGGWNGDYRNMPCSAGTWFARGGLATTGSAGGVFRFDSGAGSSYYSISSRVVLASWIN